MSEPPPNFAPPYVDPSARAPRFRMGARVRVKTGWPPGHVRTPWYVRGRAGVIERICGHFEDPQRLAYGQAMEKLPLYRVRFALGDLWREERPGYAPTDTIDVEIYEPWLEPFWDYGADFAPQADRLERELGR